MVKEQVPVLKRAAMRGDRTGTDWVVLFPLHCIGVRSVTRANVGLSRHRMVSACDGSPLQESVKSHPDAGPPEIFTSFRG